MATPGDDRKTYSRPSPRYVVCVCLTNLAAGASSVVCPRGLLPCEALTVPPSRLEGQLQCKRNDTLAAVGSEMSSLTSLVTFPSCPLEGEREVEESAAHFPPPQLSPKQGSRTRCSTLSPGQGNDRRADDDGVEVCGYLRSSPFPPPPSYIVLERDGYCVIAELSPSPNGDLTGHPFSPSRGRHLPDQARYACTCTINSRPHGADPWRLVFTPLSSPLSSSGSKSAFARYSATIQDKLHRPKKCNAKGEGRQ